MPAGMTSCLESKFSLPCRQLRSTRRRRQLLTQQPSVQDKSCQELSQQQSRSQPVHSRGRTSNTMSSSRPASLSTLSSLQCSHWQPQWPDQGMQISSAWHGAPDCIASIIRTTAHVQLQPDRCAADAQHESQYQPATYSAPEGISTHRSVGQAITWLPDGRESLQHGSAPSPTQQLVSCACASACCTAGLD